MGARGAKRFMLQLMAKLLAEETRLRFKCGSPTFRLLQQSVEISRPELAADLLDASGQRAISLSQRLDVGLR